MSKESARALHLWKMFRLKPWEADLIEKYQRESNFYQLLLGKRNVIDHDHATGQVRGKLDWLINKAYGLIEKAAPGNVSQVLLALAVYHEKPPAALALGHKTFGLTGQAKLKRKMIYGSESGETTCLLRPKKKAIVKPRKRSKKR